MKRRKRQELFRQGQNEKAQNAVFWEYQLANCGWPESLNVIRKTSLKPSQNYIGVHIIPPTYPLDGRSLENYRQSIHQREFGYLWRALLHTQAPIGHMFLSWKCPSKKGTLSITGSWSRSTDSDLDESKDMGTQLSLQGWGLTPLFLTYKDGTLMLPWDSPPIRDSEGNALYQPSPNLNQTIENEIRNQTTGQKELISFFFPVSRAHCQDLDQFIYKFLNTKGALNQLGTAFSHPIDRFSLTANPNEYEGAGCASLVTAALSSSPLLKSFFSFYQHVNRRWNIPERLLGFNQETYDSLMTVYGELMLYLPPEHGINQINKKVNLLTEFRSRETWDIRENEAAIPLEFVDIELWILAFKTIAQEYGLDDSQDSITQEAYQKLNRQYKLLVPRNRQESQSAPSLIRTEFDPYRFSLNPVSPHFQATQPETAPKTEEALIHSVRQWKDRQSQFIHLEAHRQSGYRHYYFVFQ